MKFFTFKILVNRLCEIYPQKIVELIFNFLKYYYRKYLTKNQYKNNATFYRFLVFDVDKPKAALSFESANLPEPNIVVINPKNTHAHLLYYLENPVCKTDKVHVIFITY
ncbi:MAG: replication initiation protein [bacterium]